MAMVEKNGLIFVYDISIEKIMAVGFKDLKISPEFFFASVSLWLSRFFPLPFSLPSRTVIL